MEIIASKLLKENTLESLSLYSYITGMHESGFLSLQYGFTGEVVPWAELIKLKGATFPVWSKFGLEYLTKVDGKTLSSSSIQFKKEFSKILKGGGSSISVFDENTFSTTVDADSASFVYQSGLSNWLTEKNGVTTEMYRDRLGMSVGHEKDSFCFFNLTRQDMYIILTKTQCFIRGYVQPYKDKVLELIVHHFSKRSVKPIEICLDCFNFSYTEIEFFLSLFKGIGFNFKDGRLSLFEIN